ncbi:translocation/assembly module TamB domain-containing protein [Sorangium cellulosum]|uniref:translocation/assembly module TamB domain-containing protein n=1 Tax=Sorangium cellulosum TaxID=56 RepID=UPI000CF3C9E6|nr:translocation/assembly module TamB domain-containing protein [Sorangium cellulosum]
MSSAPVPHRHGRFRRALARAAAVLGLGGVFVAAVGVGAVVHLNAAPTRNLTRQLVNDILRSSLEGQIEIAHIDRLGLFTADVARVTVRHPSGTELLHVSGVHADFNALAILNEVLLGSGDLAITIPLVRVADAGVLLAQDESGALTLGQAFTPKPSPEPPTEDGRPLRLELSRVELDHAAVHGTVAPGSPIDATVEALAGTLVVADDSRYALERVRITERRLLPVPVEATSVAGSVNVPLDAPMELSARLEGSVGAIPISAEGTLKDEHLSARVSSARVTPEAALAIDPSVPLARPVSVAVTADGELSDLSVTARVVVLDPLVTDDAVTGEITARAQLDALDPKRITAELRVTELDPRAFAGAAPAARVSAEARGEIFLDEEGGPRVVAEARTEPFDVVGQHVPATEARATFERGALRAVAQLHEPGAPIDADVALSKEGEIRFDVRSEIPSLGAVRHVPSGIHGSAALHVEGALKDDALDAKATVRVAGLRVGEDVRLGRGEVRARATGPLDKLAIQGAFQGADLRAQGYTFQSVAASASGPVTAPHVRVSLASAERRIAASAALDIERSEARQVRVDLARGQDDLTAQAARVAWGRGVAVRDLALRGDGVGELTGSLSLAGNDVEGDLRGSAIDLARIEEIVGVPLGVAGLANLDVSLHGRGDRRKGHVQIELEDGAVPGVAPRLSMNVTARLDGEALKADGLVRLIAPPEPPPDRARQARPEGASPGQPSATVGDLARRPKAPPPPVCEGAIARVLVGGSAARVRGSLLSGRTWQTVTGSARMEADAWNMGCLAQASPVKLALSELAGRLTARLAVAREHGQRLPSVRDFLVRTDGLRAAGPIDEKTGAPAWVSRKLDVRAAGDLDAKTGDANVVLSVFDKRLVAELSAGFDADLPALLADPMEALPRMPVAAHLAVPRRKLNELTELAAMGKRTPVLSGGAGLDLYFAGTLAEPRLVARATAANVGSDGRPSPLGKLRVDTLLVYDGRDAQLDAYAFRGARTYLTAKAKVGANAAALLGGGGGAPLLSAGSLEAKLDDLPLAEVPILADMQISGQARGEIAVRGLFQAPEVAARLELPGLQLGPDVHYDTAEVSLTIPKAAGAAQTTAVANVRLVGRSGGRLEAKAEAPMTWEAGAIPTLTNDQNAKVSLAVDRFRLAALEPFVQGTVNRLDGTLDGEVRLGLGAKAGFSGQMRLTDGLVHMATIGQPFENASFRVTATPSGELRIEDIRAEAGSGQVRGEATLQMEGFAFRSARAELEIPEDRELPISLEGVPMGDVRGKVFVSAQGRDDRIAVRVDIPTLNLELPPTIGRSVQPLDENEDITTSAPLSREEYEARRAPAEPVEEVQRRANANAKPLLMEVHLGRIGVEGDMVQASLSGDKARPIRINVADEMTIQGNVNILSGKLDVIGKEFEIEPGVVALRGDPSNPYLNVKAFHDTPEGTRIYIDYVGELNPITEEKITFRSEPPRPENEVIAELLLGKAYAEGTLAGGSSTEEPSSGSGSGATSGVAAGVGTGLASAQINMILQSIGPLQNFETQLDTTEEGALKTTVGYQLGQRVTASASYEAGGASQDGRTTTPNDPAGARGRTEVSLEWRFRREWSLRAGFATGEDMATSLDLLWKHRY